MPRRVFNGVIGHGEQGRRVHDQDHGILIGQD